MKKLTIDEFTSRVIPLHNGKYDYSLVDYAGAHVKVKIICPIHGSFEQRPSDHMSGGGCKKCANANNSELCRKDKVYFTSKAKVTHDCKYDYSLVEYTTNNKKVKIVCPAHGVFKQRPSDHSCGAGCPKCALDKRKMTTNDFIMKANVTHDGMYDYLESIYVTSTTKIKIKCKVHGFFYQTPVEHIRGGGCNICAGNIKFTTTDFIRKAIETHGFKYDYSSVNYINSSHKVKIVCPEHGEFDQTANDHVSGKGCSACSITGFDTSKKGTLYILRSNCGMYFKAGISNNSKRRIIELRRHTPFEFEPIAKINNSGDIVFKLEKAFHSSFESAQMKGFDGCTEWFKWDYSVNDWISMLSI